MMMRGRWSLVSGLWFLVLAFAMRADNALAFSFSVEPSRVELSVPAGKQRGKSVAINNSHSDAPLHLKVYAQDIIFLPDGTNNFQPAGTTDWSCAKWIRTVPGEIDIPAGEVQDVRVSVTAPADARGGYYAMLFFESAPSYTESGLGVNFRIGALTQVTIPGTEAYQAKLANISVAGVSDLQLEIFNESNVLIRPKGAIKVFNAGGKKVAQHDFNLHGVGVLPRTLRQFHVDLGSLAAGAYRLKAEIDYGAPYLLVGERSFEIK